MSGFLIEEVEVLMHLGVVDDALGVGEFHFTNQAGSDQDVERIVDRGEADFGEVGVGPGLHILGSRMVSLAEHVPAKGQALGGRLNAGSYQLVLELLGAETDRMWL